MPVRADDSQEGMMLAEVLVALAILSLAALSMFRVFGSTTEAIRQQRAMEARLDLAENLMALAAQPGASKPGVTTGETGGLKWRIETRPDGDSASAPAGPVALSVRINVGDLQGPPLLSSAVIGAVNAP